MEAIINYHTHADTLNGGENYFWLTITISRHYLYDSRFVYLHLSPT